MIDSWFYNFSNCLYHMLSNVRMICELAGKDVEESGLGIFCSNVLEFEGSDKHVGRLDQNLN
jgi:hypothetical protein